MTSFLRPVFLVTFLCFVYMENQELSKALSAPAAPSSTPSPDVVNDKSGGTGEPVWSDGQAFANASASGPGAFVITDAWSGVNNHGGLQVTTITSNGTVIGYQQAGSTECSQESMAQAAGAWHANATAYGYCNSTVLLDQHQPVSNLGVGQESQATAKPTP